MSQRTVIRTEDTTLLNIITISKVQLGAHFLTHLQGQLSRPSARAQLLLQQQVSSSRCAIVERHPRDTADASTGNCSKLTVTVGCGVLWNTNCSYSADVVSGLYPWKLVSKGGHKRRLDRIEVTTELKLRAPVSLSITLKYDQQA